MFIIIIKSDAKFFRAEHVAKALIHLLNNGKSGSVWLVENGQSPQEISFPKP